MEKDLGDIFGIKKLYKEGFCGEDFTLCRKSDISFSIIQRPGERVIRVLEKEDIFCRISSAMAVDMIVYGKIIRRLFSILIKNIMRQCQSMLSQYLGRATVNFLGGIEFVLVDADFYAEPNKAKSNKTRVASVSLRVESPDQYRAFGQQSKINILNLMIVIRK